MQENKVCCGKLPEGVVFYGDEEILDYLYEIESSVSDERKKIIDGLEKFISKSPKLKICGGNTWNGFINGKFSSDLLELYSNLESKYKNIYFFIQECSEDQYLLELVEVDDGIMVKQKRA